jgi:hypothetical protein
MEKAIMVHEESLRKEEGGENDAHQRHHPRNRYRHRRIRSLRPSGSGTRRRTSYVLSTDHDKRRGRIKAGSGQGLRRCALTCRGGDCWSDSPARGGRSCWGCSGCRRWSIWDANTGTSSIDHRTGKRGAIRARRDTGGVRHSGDGAETFWGLRICMCDTVLHIHPREVLIVTLA